LYNKTLGWLFIVGGAANIFAALVNAFYDGRGWLQTGVWRPVPLSCYIPLDPHLSSNLLEGSVLWILSTPVSIWAAVMGAYILRIGIERVSA
jgi:hypothetical protein